MIDLDELVGDVSKDIAEYSTRYKGNTQFAYEGLKRWIKNHLDSTIGPFLKPATLDESASVRISDYVFSTNVESQDEYNLFRSWIKDYLREVIKPFVQSE